MAPVLWIIGAAVLLAAAAIAAFTVALCAVSARSDRRAQEYEAVYDWDQAFIRTFGHRP